MAFNPTIPGGARPYIEAKLEAGAIASVAEFTGTATRTTRATGSVTLPQLAEAFKALTDDLRTRGVIS
jgi:hypothetical protein